MPQGPFYCRMLNMSGTSCEEYVCVVTRCPDPAAKESPSSRRTGERPYTTRKETGSVHPSRAESNTSPGATRSMTGKRSTFHRQTLPGQRVRHHQSRGQPLHRLQKQTGTRQPGPALQGIVFSSSRSTIRSLSFLSRIIRGHDSNADIFKSATL